MKGLGFMYLKLALCLPGAAGFTALMYWMSSLGDAGVWVALGIILLAAPIYAMGAIKLIQRIEARHGS